MPGTIQVSVLEIMGLQSSPPISQVSIKVAMGKKEYGTSAKEDFSFPLTSLRDNLIIKLLDASGREISQTGVETRLIVEKGLWDDSFPLEGGGHVHMKLQFLLSAEERDQVRAMRYTALRKKQGGLMNKSFTIPDISTDNIISNNAVSSSSFGDEASDSLLQSQAAVSETIPDNFFKIPKSGIKDTEEGTRYVEQTNTISKDTKEEHSFTSATSAEKLNSVEIKRDGKKESSSTSGESAEKLNNQILPVNVVAKAGFGSSKSPDTSSQHNLASSKPNEKPSPKGKSPSSVRNMISVFESNPVENVKKPRIKPPPTKIKASEDTVKSEFREPDTQTTTTTTNLKNVLKVINKENYINEENISAEDPIRACTEAASVSELSILDTQTTDLKNELKVIPKENYTNEENVSAEDPIRACTEAASVSKLSVLDTQMTDLKNELKVIPKENYTNEENMSAEDPIRACTSETASVSGRITIDEHSSRDVTDNLVRKGKGKEKQKENHQKELHEVNSQGVLHDKLRHEERCEEKNDSVKSDLRELDTQTTATTMKNELKVENNVNKDDIATSTKNELKVVHKGNYAKGDGISTEDLIRACISISGRIILDEHLIGDGVKTENCESRHEECWEDKNDGLDWISPNNSSRLCITTAGKQMMHIVESLRDESITHPGIITSSKPENEEEVNKNEGISQNPPENPAAVETHRGPFRQVVRVAIMVGFAALVFFTRDRRRNR